MNNNHIKTEDDYIDDLSQKIEEIGYDEYNQKEKLKELKENNKKIRETVKLSQEKINVKDPECIKKFKEALNMQ